MSVTPLAGPHIQAQGYSPGRKAKVDLLAIHTAEGAKDEHDLGNYFRGTTKGSSNAGIGQDGGYATYVHYTDTPWTNPPANSRADTVELCGFARWTRAEWLAHKAMLETCAHWIAWRAAVRGIPIVHLTGTRCTGTGVAGHKDINDTYHKSSHTDPGPNFPWDTVLARAVAITKAGAPKPAAKPPYHKDYMPGNRAPDITLVKKRFRLANTTPDYDTVLRRAIRAFKVQRHIAGNPDVIDRTTWNEVWK